MARKPSASDRLDVIEDVITPVLVELTMFKIVLERLLDVDIERCEILGLDPYRFLIEEELSEVFDEMPESDDGPPDLRRLAVARALDFLQYVDPADPDIQSGPGPANDD